MFPMINSAAYAKRIPPSGSLNLPPPTRALVKPVLKPLRLSQPRKRDIKSLPSLVNVPVGSGTTTTDPALKEQDLLLGESSILPFQNNPQSEKVEVLQRLSQNAELLATKEGCNKLVVFALATLFHNPHLKADALVVSGVSSVVGRCIDSYNYLGGCSKNDAFRLVKLLSLVRPAHAGQAVKYELKRSASRAVRLLSDACRGHTLSDKEIVEIHEDVAQSEVPINLGRAYYFAKARQAALTVCSMNHHEACRMVVACMSSMSSNNHFSELGNVVGRCTSSCRHLTNAQIGELAAAFHRENRRYFSTDRVERLMDALRCECIDRVYSGCITTAEFEATTASIMLAVEAYLPYLADEFADNAGGYLVSEVLLPESPMHLVV